MITALKAALSSSLETVILGLMKSTSQYDASEIKASIKVNLTFKKDLHQNGPFLYFNTHCGYYSSVLFI